MRVKRSFGAMVATVAVSAVLAGCGGPVVGSGAGSGSGSGSDSGSSGDGGSESRDQGGPGVGAPKDKDGKVPKPPIKVTTTRFTQGRPINDVVRELEESVRKQCGDGTLCVTITVENSEPDWEDCEFHSSRPDEGATVKRGGTIVLVAGTSPCETPSPEASPSPSPETSPSPEGSPSPEASPEESPAPEESPVPEETPSEAGQ